MGSVMAPTSQPATAEEKTAMQIEVEGLSAVKCAQVLKEKGQNFTTAVSIEALHTMSTKSSFKLREELLKQPQVKKLCEKVANLLRRPPAGLSLAALGKAAWSLARFPDEVLGKEEAQKI